MTTFLTNLVESEKPSRNFLWCVPHSFQVLRIPVGDRMGIAFGGGANRIEFLVVTSYKTGIYHPRSQLRIIPKSQPRTIGKREALVADA